MSKIIHDIIKVIPQALSECYTKATIAALRSVKKAKCNTRRSWRKVRKLSVASVKASAIENAFLISVFFGGGTLYAFSQLESIKQPEDNTQPKRLTERTFLKFASLEYNGQVFMSPQDFLESILEKKPKITKSSKIPISEQFLKYIRNRTPSQYENSPTFFRYLKGDGLISYCDYLFLLSILVKPYSAFEICFKILDTDYSGTIEKNEYLIMEQTFSRKWKTHHGHKTSLEEVTNEDLVDDEFGLQKKQSVDTTLKYHLFGKNGDKTLDYDTFKQFLLNVQRELLEIEFLQFSRGLPFITEVDFALILFRYSLSEEQHFEKFLKCKLSKQSIISFEEYMDFMNFLYLLGDFVFALRFYTQTQTQISRQSFHEVFQMMKQHNLSYRLIETVFNMFDVNENGYIFYQDFINVMNERLNRGFTKRPEEQRGYLSQFRRCLRDSANSGSSMRFFERFNKSC